MLNFAVITGRLGMEPVLRQTKSGTNVLSASVAVQRDLDPHAERNNTDWIYFEAWEKAAEHVCKYLHKGDELTVAGRLFEKKWTDVKGIDQYRVMIKAEKIYFGAKNNDRPGRRSPNVDFDEMDGDDGNLPF